MRRVSLSLLILFLSASCAKDEPPQQLGLSPVLDAGAERDARSENGATDGGEPTDAAAFDAGAPVAPDSGPDAAQLVPKPLPELRTRPPAAPPSDILAGAAVESCEVFQAETCEAGTRRRCEVYDTSTAEFVEPSPLFRRVLLYDRWYDLYHQPQGQTAERVYSRVTPAGTPESQWGSDDGFARYTGLSDAAIWNGAALLSASMRYQQTGTEADYARMERKTRDMLLQFDVTQIPGYLARHHFLLVDPQAPQRQDVVLRHDAASLDHRERIIEDPSTVADLPAIYRDGFDDEDGTRWTGTPMWEGNPSIDQYTGPRTAFPMAHGLLRDEALKTRMAEHLVCYLNRLERIEIRNLQQNPDAVEAVTGYFGAGATGLDLDPGDPDLLLTDTVVFYVTRQLNAANEQSFDRACPASPQVEPVEVIDATADDFLLQILKIVADIDSRATQREEGIDHFYVPSIRGPDALHLMHMAALAYHFTGQEQYRRFLFEELIAEIGTLEVAKTTGAFVPSRFCRKFFGHHIGFAPNWAFLAMLEDQPLREALEDVFRTEFWQKEMFDQWNAKFEIFYVGEVEDDATARAEAVAALHDLGGNGGVFDDPRRSYWLDPNQVAANLPAGNELVCPSVEEIEFCERDITFGALTVPGETVTLPCLGQRPECPIGDRCVRAQTRDPLPPSLRRYDDFMWQRNPYRVGSEELAVEGGRQSPGLDLTEEFWLARHYGLVDDGAGQALAWRDVGSCP